MERYDAKMEFVLRTVKMCIDFNIDIPAWCYSYVRRLQADSGARMVANALSGDPYATAKFNQVLLGIERRWDALMKRRSEPKRAAWKVDVLGDMPNN